MLERKMVVAASWGADFGSAALEGRFMVGEACAGSD